MELKIQFKDLTGDKNTAKEQISKIDLEERSEEIIQNKYGETKKRENYES